MIAAIAGDIIGSIYERDNQKIMDFPLFSNGSRFTDDTVLTIAVADAVLNGKDYAATIMKWGNRYPHAGYGGTFKKWLSGEIEGPYDSWGNGSAMRVSPVGFAFNTMEEVLGEAKKTADVSHNHPEGVKGAQAIAAAIFLARTGNTKAQIKDFIETKFEYNLSRTLDAIRPSYSFDVSCQGSVPESIIAFLESTDVEDAIRKAISLGGDSDTIACMAGGIAQAFFDDVSEEVMEGIFERLPTDMLEVLDAFEEKFG